MTSRLVCINPMTGVIFRQREAPAGATCTPGDNEIAMARSGGGVVTVQLPPPNKLQPSMCFGVLDADGVASPLTPIRVDGNGTLIDGSAQILLLASPGQAVSFVFDGDQFRRIITRRTFDRGGPVLELASDISASSGGGGGGVLVNTFANRPAASIPGRVFQATDNDQRRYIDDGAAWRPFIGNRIGIEPPAAATLIKKGASIGAFANDVAGALRLSSNGVQNESELFALPVNVTGHQFVFEAAFRWCGIFGSDPKVLTNHNLPIGLAVQEAGTRLKRFCYYSASGSPSHIQWQNYVAIGGPNTDGANDRVLHTYEFDFNQVVWLRLIEDAVHRTYFFSTDGVCWYVFDQEPVNTFVAATARVGFWLDGAAGDLVTADVLHSQLTLLT